jgi:hypothetical protein
VRLIPPLKVASAASNSLASAAVREYTLVRLLSNSEPSHAKLSGRESGNPLGRVLASMEAPHWLLALQLHWRWG